MPQGGTPAVGSQLLI